MNMRFIKKILWKLWTDERGELAPAAEPPAAPAQQPTEQTWSKSEGVGGDIDDNKEASLDDPTNNTEKVIENTVRAVEELGVKVEDEEKDEDKKDEEPEDKTDESTGEPEKKEESEPDKKDKALDEALAKIAELEDQMVEIRNEKEEQRIEEQRRKDREASEEDQAIRDALLKTPDDELSDTELKMKKYLQNQDARMDRLERSLGEQSNARTVEAYQKRFDNILETYNKDGEEWLTNNDTQTIAVIAQRHETDDIEGIAEAMVKDKKAEFNKRLEKEKQKIISDYIGKKKGDKDKTPVVEKGGDAPPPDRSEKLSMDKPKQLKKSFINTFLAHQGKKA